MRWHLKPETQQRLPDRVARPAFSTECDRKDILPIPGLGTQRRSEQASAGSEEMVQETAGEFGAGVLAAATDDTRDAARSAGRRVGHVLLGRWQHARPAGRRARPAGGGQRTTSIDDHH